MLSSTQGPDDEGSSIDTPDPSGNLAVGSSRHSRFGRTASTPSAAGLSTSYSLPTRSYIHHAGHGSQGMHVAMRNNYSDMKLTLV